MTTLTGKAADFLALHRATAPLLQPNAFDIGSARLLESLGFAAIATTSSGFAATLGRLDGGVTRDESLAHGAALAGAVSIPVAADTENGFADDPVGVAETVRLACATGLARSAGTSQGSRRAVLNHRNDLVGHACLARGRRQVPDMGVAGAAKAGFAAQGVVVLHHQRAGALKGVLPFSGRARVGRLRAVESNLLVGAIAKRHIG